MAIVVDVGNISSSGDEANQSSYTWSHTCSADVTLLTVVVRTRDTSSGDSDVSGITYNGDPFTNAVKLYDAGSDMGVQVWWLATPDTGSSLTIEVTHGGAVSDASAAGIGLEGAEISSPVDLTDTDVVASGNVTLDFTGRDTGAIAIGGSVLDENTPNKLSVITGTEADEVDMGSYQANSAYNLGDTIVMGSADGDVDFVGAGATFKEGASAFEVSVTDGVELGDETSETMAASPTRTDGIDGGDTTSELSVMEVATNDGVKLGDTPSSELLLMISATDGLKLGDDTSESIIATVLITDGIKIGDTTTNLMIVLPSVSDGIIFGDTLLIESGVVVYQLTVTDGLKVGDTSSLEMATFSIVNDGVKIGDVSLVTISSEVSVSDGIKLGDITVGNINYSVVVSDGFKMGDLATETITVTPRGVKNLGQSEELKLYLKMIEMLSERRIE